MNLRDEFTDLHLSEARRRHQVMPAGMLDRTCVDCGGTYTIRDYQPHECPERVTPLKIAGLTIFMLVLFASIAYGLPIIDAAVRS